MPISVSREQRQRHALRRVHPTHHVSRTHKLRRRVLRGQTQHPVFRTFAKVVHHVGGVDRPQALQRLQVPELHRAVVAPADQNHGVLAVEQDGRHCLLVTVKHVQLRVKRPTRTHHERGGARVPQSNGLVLRRYASPPQSKRT